MSEDIFDDIIKEKLQGMPPKASTDDVWSVFEASAAHNNAHKEEQDATFDKFIKDNLQTIQPVYRSEHWQLLKSQMKTIEERKDTIFITKILEFAAIFLIVFTYFNWSGWMVRKDHTADPLFYATTTQSDETNIVNKIPTSDALEKNTQTVKSNGSTSPKDVVKSEYHISSSDNGYTKYASIIETEPTNRMESLAPEIPIISTSDLALVNLGVQKNDSKDITKISDEIAQLPQPIIISPIADINTDVLSSEFALSFPMNIIGLKPKPEYAISAYGSGDINLINTPFDKLYSRASYNREALNRSIGINVSKKIEQFELETGIGYAKREYQPDQFREAFGQKENYYSEVSLDKIKFDIASLPITFKYHFINQSNWGAYIMAGAALNLVMNARYDVTESKILGRPAPDRFIPEEPRLESKPFIEGLLSGENFKDNYFVSVGFGFGIQKKLFNNTSIYVQPSYHRQILSADIGIGPNKDKIHTSSLQFGIKTVL